MPEALANGGNDLSFRSAGHEHDKTEAESALVLVVHRGELSQARSVDVTALLAARERREGHRVGPDPRVSVEHADAFGLGHPQDLGASRRHDLRGVAPSKAIREPGSALRSRS